MSKIAGLDDLKFGFRDEVRDTVTGYQGQVTGITVYLNGCVQYSVSAKREKPSDKPEAFWIDQVQLELVNAHDEQVHPIRATGGPTSATRPGE
jgi:hypothetical protein